MVLCLPILLFLMALMINIGTVACWKVRAHSVARQAVWGGRFPRIVGSNPRPDYWPETAGMGGGWEDYWPALDDPPAVDDPRVDLPVARGPVLSGAAVNEGLLDPTRGFCRGWADLERGFPMLGKMGGYHLRAEAHLLDDAWPYQRMSSLTTVGTSRTWRMVNGKWQYQEAGPRQEGYRLHSNRQPRIPVIYALAKAPPALVGAYVQAALALLEAPFQPELRPLDNDEEFRCYKGYAPDFHPRLRKFGSLDLELAARRVEDLIDRIQGKVERDDQGNVRKTPGVPETMTRAFISLYQGVINQLKSQSGTDPLPPPVQAKISELEKKIEILRQFLATLQSNDGN